MGALLVTWDLTSPKAQALPSGSDILETDTNGSMTQGHRTLWAFVAGLHADCPPKPQAHSYIFLSLRPVILMLVSASKMPDPLGGACHWEAPWQSGFIIGQIRAFDRQKSPPNGTSS